MSHPDSEIKQKFSHSALPSYKGHSLLRGLGTGDDIKMDEFLNKSPKGEGGRWIYFGDHNEHIFYICNK